MSNINTGYNDRVYYELQHASGIQPVAHSDIIGWNDDEKELARNLDYEGIFSKFSNALKFKGEALSFINTIRNIYGPNAKIRLIKNVKDNNLVWQREYTGFLNMKTWEMQDNQVSLKFHSGGLEEQLKSRKNDKIEIERTESLSGKTITDLELSQLHLPGRKIFKTSILKGTETESAAFNLSAAFRSPIMKIQSESDDHIQSVFDDYIPFDSDFEDWYDLNPGVINHFYLNNDRQKRLKLKGSFRVRNNPSGTSSNFIDVAIIRTDENQNVIEGNYVYQSGINNETWREIEFEYEQDLGENEGLVLVFASQIFSSGSTTHTLKYTKAEFTIEEESFFEASTVKGIMAYELLERVVEIITGSKKNFKSDYFGRTDLGYAVDGPGAHIFFSHGHWIRQFEKGDDLYKPFVTSWNDAIESLMVLENVGVGIAQIGLSEQIIVEDAKFFNNNNVLIRLGKEVDGEFVYTQVSKVKRSNYEHKLYSSIEIGSEKGGENEEIMGLEETNTQANYTTPIEDGKTYKQIMKYRTDTNGEEIIRRQDKFVAATTDTDGDLDIWAHDVKPSETEIWQLKTWEDVLEAEPINYFDPDSGYNFLWSPTQLLIRKHGWKLNASLQYYNTREIQFGSSKGKSNVTIQAIGETAYTENENIPISALEQPRSVPEKIEFEFAVDTELNKIIDGYTLLNGKKIPNKYGLVEFKNEKGELEKGRIQSMKPNKKGNWELEKYQK
jgi:hypothetical protein